MRSTVLALALGAGALLGVGVWIGRSSSARSEPPATEPARIIMPPTVTRPVLPAAAPVLPSPARVRPTPLPGLVKDLRDPDPKIRRAAIHEAAIDPDTDPAILLAMSRDADVEVGFAAMAALATHFEAGEVPLQEMLSRATDHVLDPKVRMLALNALGRTPSAGASEALCGLLRSGDLDERRTAAILLSRQDPEAAIPALIAALSDADETVRANALESLRARARGRDFATDAAAWRAWWQGQH